MTGKQRKRTGRQIHGNCEWLELWQQLYAYIPSRLGLRKV